jgi:hypothetical protein
VLDYDPETGEFRWKVRLGTTPGIKRFNTRYAEKPAGCPDVYGYIQITVDGRNYKAHRLAWLHYHGFLPKRSMDHRDCGTANNAISNLRPATQSQQLANQRRRKTAKPGGSKGCYWSERDRKWVAAIWVDGRRSSLGYHRQLADAQAAYAKAAKALHREFARFGEGAAQ